MLLAGADLTGSSMPRASLRGADLRGARIDGVDFYLVDLRDVKCTIDQNDHFRRCSAILYDRARATRGRVHAGLACT